MQFFGDEEVDCGPNVLGRDGLVQDHGVRNLIISRKPLKGHCMPPVV